MDRIIEPELMEEEEQGLAYGQADFSGPNKQFIALFAAKFPDFSRNGRVLDLGCGPADILIRFALRYPDCECVGIDGAEAMLAPGRRVIEKEKFRAASPCTANACPFQVAMAVFRQYFPTASCTIFTGRKSSGRPSVTALLPERQF
jgi:SAM-dependent methyltransferase